jgi:hypothetical protein
VFQANIIIITFDCGCPGWVTVTTKNIFKSMGIVKADCTFLFYAKTLNVNFESTCTLGRLKLYAEKSDISACLQKYGNGSRTLDEVKFTDDYSEPLFEILGAKKFETLDFSSYENASIIHDLNVPIPKSLHNTFSCVLDSGTLEHVFNFPVAIKSCMEATKVGGHYIGITPVNNQMGHGFYQFSPELFYRIFSEENGFRIIKMLIAVTGQDDMEWYEVADPKNVSNRVMVVNNFPLSLMFIAEKISNKEIFASTPQQSDYTATWNAFSSVKENKAELSGSRFKYLYRKLMPHRLKVVLRNLYDIYKKEKIETAELGVINPEYFKKVTI